MVIMSQLPLGITGCSTIMACPEALLAVAELKHKLKPLGGQQAWVPMPVICHSFIMLELTQNTKLQATYKCICVSELDPQNDLAT